MDRANSNSVNGPNGAYNLLGQYNGHQPGSLSAPYVPPTTVTGSYLVPCYSPIQYDSLTHGQAPTYAGYFTIQDGYGKSANNCNTKYVQRLCNGAVNCGGGRPTQMPY